MHRTPRLRVAFGHIAASPRTTNSAALNNRGNSCEAASIRNGWLVAPYGGPVAARHCPGSTICGRKGWRDPGTVRRSVDETFPNDGGDVPAVLSKQLVVPEATHYLPGPGVKRGPRNLQRFSVLGVHATFEPRSGSDFVCGVIEPGPKRDKRVLGRPVCARSYPARTGGSYTRPRIAGWRRPGLARCLCRAKADMGNVKPEGLPARPP